MVVENIIKMSDRVGQLTISFLSKLLKQIPKASKTVRG